MLNENERKVMEALGESSAGNGHDFGYVEDTQRIEGLTRHQIAGYVGDLAKKRYIDIYEKEKGYDVTQFIITEKGFACLGLGPHGEEV